MAYLSLRHTKEGKPHRFYLSCKREEKDLVFAVGRGTARWVPSRQVWSLPLEPLIVRDLYETFPGLKVHPEVAAYLTEKTMRQTKARAATEDNSFLFMGDKLWPFQRGSVRFLAETRRGILGHKMGLGKTVIAAVGADQLGLNRVLVVCNDGAKYSWADHFKEWASLEVPSVVHSGSMSKVQLAKLREQYRLIHGKEENRTRSIESLVRGDGPFVLILNYAQLRIHAKSLGWGEYDLVIVDEAHRIGNRKSQQTRAAQAISERSLHTWLLTGTAIRNNYDNIWALLHICDPERFSSYWGFVDYWCESITDWYGVRRIVGLRNEGEFNRMLSTYMYRKEKHEVLPDLPPKLYVDYRIEMHPAQAAMYHEMEKDAAIAIQSQLADGRTLEHLVRATTTVAQITRLRQLALSPALLGGTAYSGKLDAIVEMVPDIVAEGQKVLIFSCFRGFLPLVGVALEDLDISIDYIMGGVPADKRRQIEQDLNDGNLQVVLGTIGAMGESLNLQGASVVIFADLDWVPGVNEQAEDRVHRGTITSSPTIIRLYQPGTVDSDIRSVCLRKTRIVDETEGQVEAIRQILLRHDLEELK